MTQALPTLIPNRLLASWIANLLIVTAVGAASLWLSPLAIVAVPIVVMVGLVVLRWPSVGALALVASVPAQQLGAFGSGGMSLTVTRACLPLAVVGLVLHWTVRQRPLFGSRLALPFLALLLWMFVTVQVATDVSAASSELVRWLIAFLAFFVVLDALSTADERVIPVLIGVIALVGALEAGVGTVLGLMGFGPASFLVENAFSRAYGTFGRPNTFAGYLEIVIFPVAWFGVYMTGQALANLRIYADARCAGFAASRGPRLRLTGSVVFATFLIGSSAVILSGILVSFSRGAWLGVAAGGVATGLLALRRHWGLLVPALPVVALVVAVWLAFVAPATLTDRLSSIAEEARPFDAASITIDDENFAVAERMAHWQAGWRMFEDRPLAGVGIGNFNERYPDYFVREEFRSSQGHAHNYYIHLLAETGVVGLAIYLTLILSFWFVALRVAIATDDPLARALALGAFGTMTAIYVHNFFENLHVLNLGIQISATWALALAAHRRWRDTSTGALRHMEYSPK